MGNIFTICTSNAIAALMVAYIGNKILNKIHSDNIKSDKNKTKSKGE